MRFEYPMRLEEEDGELFLAFPDFTEIISGWSKEELKEVGLQKIAREALVSALQARMDFYDEIPMPSSVSEGEKVYLPPMIASKLLLYMELRRRGVPKRKFASELNLRPTDAQRVLDLRHESRTDILSSAFAALGLEIGVSLNVVPKLDLKMFGEK